jgi:predicted transcriptional regulator
MGVYMANASSKVHAVFQSLAVPLTLNKIKAHAPDLKSSEISMALHYLQRQRFLTREQVDNSHGKGRKKVWLYQYHPERLPKEIAA